MTLEATTTAPVAPARSVDWRLVEELMQRTLTDGVELDYPGRSARTGRHR